MDRIVRVEARDIGGPLLSGATFAFYVNGKKVANTSGGDGFATLQPSGPVRSIAVKASYMGKSQRVSIADNAETTPIYFDTNQKPPEPPPVIDQDDLQRGRWGGLAEAQGRKLSAVLVETWNRSFAFDLVVESTDDSPLIPPVRFHLHDSYDRHIQDIRAMRGGGKWARWEGIVANEAYVVGVQVRDKAGRWIGLEFDLNNLTGLPQRLKDPAWVREQRRRRQSGANGGTANLQLPGDVKSIANALGDALSPDELRALILPLLDPKKATELSQKPGESPEKLIRTVIKDDRVPELIAQAIGLHPRNGLLARLAPHFVQMPWRAPSEERFQRIVNKDGFYRDYGQFLGQLQRISPLVCSIEYPTPQGMQGGTGLLFASDRVLTNYHVIEPVHKGCVAPDAVIVRFDYRTRLDGSSLRLLSETRVALKAGDWLGRFSPYAEDKPDLLDFAVVKLAEKVGAMPIGPSPALGSTDNRGWMNLATETAQVGSGEDVAILHHPGREPLKLSFGKITEVASHGRRLRYDANAEPGSSGSPIFSTRLRLVAIHQAGDDKNAPAKSNEGIPISHIVASLVED